MSNQGLFNRGDTHKEKLVLSNKLTFDILGDENDFHRVIDNDNVEVQEKYGDTTLMTYTTTGVEIDSELTVVGDLTAPPLFVDSINDTVGIGINNSNHNLQVDSSTTISTVHLTNSITGSAFNEGVLIQENGTDTIITNNESGSIILETNSVSNGFTLIGDKVGINKALPTVELDVVGTVAATQLNLIESDVFITNVIGEMTLNTNSTSRLTLSDTTVKVVSADFTVNGTTLFVDSSNENVIIGSSSPNSSVNLQIHEPNDTVCLTQFSNTTTTNAATRGLLVGQNGIESFFENKETNGHISFTTAGNGNVGINTITPTTASLVVNTL